MKIGGKSRVHVKSSRKTRVVGSNPQMSGPQASGPQVRVLKCRIIFNITAPFIFIKNFAIPLNFQINKLKLLGNELNRQLCRIDAACGGIRTRVSRKLVLAIINQKMPTNTMKIIRESIRKSK